MIIKEFVAGSIQLSTLLFTLYILVFSITAVTCFASIPRTRQIKEPDTRRGLVALLATSGVWAASHVGYLAAPTPRLQHGFYVVGLIVGLSTVGPWLYFCSAYTGRSLHRNTTYQKVVIGVYLGIVGIKLTNSLHELYYTASPTSDPFQHLMIDHGALHWLAMGLAYSLAIIGIFMLFEQFGQIDYDTKPFISLVGFTAMPVIFDIAGYATTIVIDITYSALGVAIFALGVLFMYADQFESIRLAGQYDEPVIILDNDDQIQDHNPAAETLFPKLAEAAGGKLASAFPKLANNIGVEDVFEHNHRGEPHYYRLTTEQLQSSRAQFGQLIILTDVTEQEQHRQQLENRNEQLEEFTGTVSHDLRNPLNIAQGNTELIHQLVEPIKDSNRSYEPPSHETINAIETASETLTRALKRMEALIEDLLVLAREGEQVDDTEQISVATLSKNCWTMVETPDSTLVVNSDVTVEADANRLRQLFENLFRNAIEHSSQKVTIRVGSLDQKAGFYVEDTGPGIPKNERDDVFNSGYTTNREGTGLGLSIIKKIVEAHGWRITLTESVEGGTRFEVTTTEFDDSD